MKRRSFVGGAFAGMSIPRRICGTSESEGRRHSHHDLRQDRRQGQRHRARRRADGSASGPLPTAAAHVRRVYDLGVTYFDCARSYWDGKSEEAYGIGLEGVRKNVFLTTQDRKRTAKEARAGAGHLPPPAARPITSTSGRCTMCARRTTSTNILGPGRRDGGLRGGEEGRQVPLHRLHRPLRSRRRTRPC